LHRVHGGPGACQYSFAVRWRGPTGWSAESTSRRAFHNALGGLKPRRQAVRSSFVPAWRYRRKSALLTIALEAEPALAVFGRDGCAPVEWNPTSLWRLSPLGTTGERLGPTRGRPPVDLSSLCRGGRHQPHFPPSAPCVEKRPITHRQVLRRRFRRQSACRCLLCRAGAKRH
jgi:hypothetical protein